MWEQVTSIYTPFQCRVCFPHAIPKSGCNVVENWSVSVVNPCYLLAITVCVELQILAVGLTLVVNTLNTLVIQISRSL